MNIFYELSKNLHRISRLKMKFVEDSEFVEGCGRCCSAITELFVEATIYPRTG
jgi:hypothetical protein